MPASQTRTTRLPNDLAAAAEIRAKELGYPNWNAYIKGLIRYDLLVLRPHYLTVPLSSKPLEDQDAHDAKLLEYTKSGKGEKGQLLEHILERMGKEGADLKKAMGL